MTNVFTGKEFAKRLAEGTLKEPIARVGMVKRHDKADTILFAEGGCQQWLEIPVGQIEQVTFLSNVSCNDHQHPLVMLEFKEPDANNAAATVFAALARRAGHASRVPPGSSSQGTIDLRPGGPGGLRNTPTDLPCLTWSIKCGWKYLYVKELQQNVPIYVCWKECETYGTGSALIE